MNHTEWIHQAARLHTAGQAFALVTVLHTQAPTSGRVGDKAVVTADGQIHGWIGGGCAQPAVLKTVRRALLDGQARRVRIAPAEESSERTLGDVLEFGMACHSGGTLELFVDPVLPAAMLTVIGDSPVARALVSLAPRVGMRVAAVAQGAQAADFPDAATVLSADDAASVQQQLSATAFVVVATQGRRDLQGLKAALALQPQGLWFVASAKKAEVLRNSLVASGENAAEVARIIAPAGESIGAQTPEEIALAVLTSVVAARRGRAIHPQPAPSLTQTTAPMGMAGGVAAASCCSAAAPEIANATGHETAGSCCGGGSALSDTPVPPALAAVAAVPALASLGSASCCKN